MSRREFAIRDPDLRGVRVLVVGLGRSGIAAARLARGRGAEVTVTDVRPPGGSDPALDSLAAAGVHLHLGGNPPELAVEADLLVVSPGVPPTIDLVSQADRLGVPIWSEVELAARFARGRIVGVTGSNGKSTVTTMVAAICRAAELTTRAGGNLGTPFADLVADGQTGIYVLELSSFQLELTATLDADIAIVTNLSPDHLDRHPDLDAYARAKARLLENQSAEHTSVLNADDPGSRRFDPWVPGEVHLFSTAGKVHRGAFLDGERLVLRTPEGELTLMDVAELPVPGLHNVANALAAAAGTSALGCSPEKIADGLRTFTPLPHRMELVGERGGIRFYNDSKATNPDATLSALTAFSTGSVHLILGGRDKGADWRRLKEPVRRSCRRVLLVGEAAGEISEHLAGTVELVECGTVEEAVREGEREAGPGEVVLLSPGCSSFDQYRNFEERGEDFRRAVLAGGRDA